MQEQLFVGRQSELDELNGHLERALAGHGQVCFITGEAGAGKTALVRHFLQQAFAACPDLVAAVGSCNAQTGIGDPYLPFREVLTMLTGDDSTQSASKVTPENTHRLRKVFVRSVQVLVEIAPDLVGLFVPGARLVGVVGKTVATKAGWMDQLERLAKRPAAVTTDQSHIFEQYTAFLQRLSTQAPLILFLDDLQWADRASLGLLFHLARRIEANRVLILGAYRPNDVALGRDGERHPLEPIVHELTRYYGDISVDLDAIPETASRAFVDALLDAEPNDLEEDFRRALFDQTAGHALFTVELIRSMQERGNLVRDDNGRWVQGGSLDWSALPARVEGVIAERIGRLDDELRETLTVASVEGEQFAAEVVARTRAIAEREAVRQLSHDLQRIHRLVSAQGLVRFQHVQVALYRFLHNLFQQYLYDSLGEGERASLHRDMGEAIEALYADQTEEVSAQLARHFEEGGVLGKGAAYRLEAGRRAHRMSAHHEAAAHLSRGLELLTELPQGPERIQLELGLQTCLGTTLIATHGYASSAVERAFTRARELCRMLGDPPQVMPVLYGLCLFRLVRAELEQAHEEGEQLLALAQRSGSIDYILGCHVQLGASAFYQGRFEQARAHLDQAITMYDRTQHADLAYLHGQDPCVTALSYLSWVLWIQGYPDQALQAESAALARATEIGHPYSLAFAMAFGAALQEFMRRWSACKAQAEKTLQAAKEGHFPIWQAMATMLHATALAYQGNADLGITELLQGLSGLISTGTELSVFFYRARLAEVYMLAGRRGEGLQALDESLSSGEQVWWRPEQRRLRAELLLLTPDTGAEAEAELRQALELARSQGSRSLELRAVTSLARLLRAQGRATEGQAELAEVCRWFTEGHDTPDLQEAKELLEELAEQQVRTLIH